MSITRDDFDNIKRGDAIIDRNGEPWKVYSISEHAARILIVHKQGEMRRLIFWQGKLLSDTFQEIEELNSSEIKIIISS